MAISKVIMPTTVSGDCDYDFMAFSFNGLHSWDDFKIVRVSSGDRYNIELGPEAQDKTAENSGGDGMYYFGTNHRQKVFNIDFAFEEIDDVTIRNIKRWLSGKELGDLWFEEEPYKVYSVKVTGQPTIKYVPFDQYLSNGTTKRIYRGEGNVQFTAFWPYAHTPDKIYLRTTDANGFTSTGTEKGNGKDLDSYGDFNNKDEWKIASGLTSSTGSCTGENPGDLPAPFVLSVSGNVAKNTTITVGDASIVIGADCSNLEWDSKTGIVKTKTSTTEETYSVVPTIGNSVATIPFGGITGADKITIKKGSSYTNGDYKIDSGEWKEYDSSVSGNWKTTTTPTLKYHYWYY